MHKNMPESTIWHVLGTARDMPVNTLPPAQSWGFDSALSKPVGIVQFRPMAQGQIAGDSVPFLVVCRSYPRETADQPHFWHTSWKIQDFFNVKKYVCRTIWAELC